MRIMKVGFLMIFVFMLMLFVTNLPGTTFINYLDYLLMGVGLFVAGVLIVASKS